MRKQRNHAETGYFYEQGGQLEVANRYDYGRGAQPEAVKDAETHCCYEQREAASRTYSAQIVGSSEWFSNKSSSAPKTLFNSNYRANRAPHDVRKEKRRRVD